MNRALLNLLMLLAVMGLGTAAYFKHQKNAEPKAQLMKLAPEAITTVEIAWKDAPVIKLRKQGSDWLMTEPVAARVDGFEILSVTNLASTEVQEVVSKDELSLKEIGLESPSHVVTLNGTAIAFGDTEPLNARRFVKIGEQVMLIDDPASPALDKDYQELISKQLFAKTDEIVAFELPGGLSFSKGSDGQWLAATPSELASATNIAKLAAGWQNAASLYNEAAPEASVGERVKIRLKSGVVHDFVVAALEPQLSLYSEALKIRYVLSKALIDELLRLPAAPVPEPPAPEAAEKPEAPPAPTVAEQASPSATTAATGAPAPRATSPN